MAELTEREALELIEHGLRPRAAKPKRVIVVGAGVAGLVAAQELLHAGHDPVILEAQHRVGGRILTLREPFFPGLYAEAGAMRIPTSHRLTLAYVSRFGFATRPFLIHNPRAHVYFRNVGPIRLREYEAQPDMVGFELEPHERGTTCAAMWETLLQPLRAQLGPWDRERVDVLLAPYRDTSVRAFLLQRGWSPGAIEMFGLFNNYEALLNSSVVELLTEELGNYYGDLVTIRGGMDQLPQAFLKELSPRIRFGARMIALSQRSEPPYVSVEYQTIAGRFREEGDRVVVTVPFPVLRHVEATPPFSYAKQRAIRQLYYDAAAKIFLQFRRRFWEQDEGICGGASVTDLPIRNVFYPQHAPEEHDPGEHSVEAERGIVLASYTWSEDAQRWGSLSPSDRIAQALENLVKIHGRVAEQEFEVGASKIWHDDEFAGGAYALFLPGQHREFHQTVIAQEGRVHFAGEHASRAHAWIQGSIESGLRAAREVHQAAD